jgi:hypothetical protein
MLLTVFLAVAAAGVAARTYLFWQDALGALPTVTTQNAPSAAAESEPQIAPRPLANTDMIIGKNLFDPERGATRAKDAEADSRALARIKSLILMGTAILGSHRYAILQDGGGSVGSTIAGRVSAPTRYKVGDTVEGFSLSEIRDKNVVFSKGASRVELALDYFRKVEAPPRSPTAQGGVSGAAAVPGRVAPVSPLVPRILPQLPRRQRLPAPPRS